MRCQTHFIGLSNEIGVCVCIVGHLNSSNEIFSVELCTFSQSEKTECEQNRTNSNNEELVVIKSQWDYLFRFRESEIAYLYF